jgi:adenylate kinase
MSIEIEDAVIEARMTGRRVCSGLRRELPHHGQPAESRGRLRCRAAVALVIRKDDKPRRRCSSDWQGIYHAETEALKGYYRDARQVLKLGAKADQRDRGRHPATSWRRWVFQHDSELRTSARSR